MHFSTYRQMFEATDRVLEDGGYRLEETDYREAESSPCVSVRKTKSSPYVSVRESFFYSTIC